MGSGSWADRYDSYLLIRRTTCSIAADSASTHTNASSRNRILQPTHASTCIHPQRQADVGHSECRRRPARPNHHTLSVSASTICTLSRVRRPPVCIRGTWGEWQVMTREREPALYSTTARMVARAPGEKPTPLAKVAELWSTSCLLPDRCQTAVDTLSLVSCPSYLVLAYVTCCPIAEKKYLWLL